MIRVACDKMFPARPPKVEDDLTIVAIAIQSGGIGRRFSGSVTQGMTVPNNVHGI
jgi:hypothetical protein